MSNPFPVDKNELIGTEGAVDYWSDAARYKLLGDEYGELIPSQGRASGQVELLRVTLNLQYEILNNGFGWNEGRWEDYAITSRRSNVKRFLDEDFYDSWEAWFFRELKAFRSDNESDDDSASENRAFRDRQKEIQKTNEARGFLGPIISATLVLVMEQQEFSSDGTAGQMVDRLFSVQPNQMLLAETRRALRLLKLYNDAQKIKESDRRQKELMSTRNKILILFADVRERQLKQEKDRQNRKRARSVRCRLYANTARFQCELTPLFNEKKQTNIGAQNQRAFYCSHQCQAQEWNEEEK